ncbi:glycosyltransferase family 92 protein RCOM_0530710 [Neltuma alba]|uniref:glycosyltransferase family 92 protein RCOM_0530710 n=1 Tax=Neltuma alba TaxID=207710 RepID=UPI0010A52E01|nr:glycosyltransferase family 92 protein RCOM_0530710 [Prosopis alba]
MMDPGQRRKRKRVGTGAFSLTHYFSLRSLFLCSSFFVFLFFLSSDRFSISSSPFRPAIITSPLSLLSSSASRSVLASSDPKLLPLRVEDRIVFPDHVVLMVSNKILRRSQDLECIYYKLFNGSSDEGSNQLADIQTQSVLSTDDYDEFRSIVRCPIPQMSYSAAAVDLRQRGEVGRRDWDSLVNQTAQSWDKVAYEAILDGNTTVVFVKGLNLRPHKISDPTKFLCHFGLKNLGKENNFLLTTKAVSVAQEVVRCLLPRGIRNSPDKAQGIRVTVSHLSGHIRRPVRELLPSVARVRSSSPQAQKRKGKTKKHELCACTMVWNQASALREWIMYHSWLGVERWFIYDNNSDDDIEKVIHELDLQGYNVSRQTWPWIKTQEAGFSHCALRARDECKWVGFFDVDEFFYFPNEFHHQFGHDVPGENSLKSVVANLSSSKIAEIRTACHSFGPSGLRSPPKRGVTIGYTCRLQSPERHKSIVRPDLLDTSLLNVVHHFQLRNGYKYQNMPESTAIINHYKYQVWETFKAKFFRRVATYVVDWQEDQNKGSKDRAPGLGTEAIEPPNWRLQFCEVWDTGLKDFLLSRFAEPVTGVLPWERSFL